MALAAHAPGSGWGTGQAWVRGWGAGWLCGGLGTGARSGVTPPLPLPLPPRPPLWQGHTPVPVPAALLPAPGTPGGHTPARACLTGRLCVCRIVYGFGGRWAPGTNNVQPVHACHPLHLEKVCEKDHHSSPNRTNDTHIPIEGFRDRNPGEGDKGGEGRPVGLPLGERRLKRRDLSA